MAHHQVCRRKIDTFIRHKSIGQSNKKNEKEASAFNNNKLQCLSIIEQL